MNYKFDIRLGHYIPINEGQVPQAADGEQDQSKDESLQLELTSSAALTNLETIEITQLRKIKEAELKTIKEAIAKKTDIILQLQKLLDELLQKGDQVKVTAQQKTLLQAQLELENKKLELAKKDNELTLKILSAQAKLLEGITLPLKYWHLNESNIQNAKVHINKLIKNDPQERIKGMIDFKKCFKDSNLLYGKDHDGYFAVCVDQSDFNKLTDTLEEAGFLRSEILEITLPQIFDRSKLTK